MLALNPLVPNKGTGYELTPEQVECVVFCAKNYAPILPRLHEITDRFPTYFYYTITAYGRDIEPGVPSLEASMETLLQLSRQVGRQRLAWRYDPVLLTETYTIQRHLDTVAHMAETLTPYVDRGIFSFVERYKKLETNMPELLPLTPEDREALADLIDLSLCGQRWAAKGNVVFYWSFVPYRSEWRYGIYAHRMIMADMGHVGENLYLACAALGLGTCGIGAYDQKLFDKTFGLDGGEEFPIYTQSVGTVKAEDEGKEKAFYSFVEEQGL